MCYELGPHQYLYLWDVAQSKYGTAERVMELQFLTPEAKKNNAHSNQPRLPELFQRLCCLLPSPELGKSHPFTTSLSLIPLAGGPTDMQTSNSIPTFCPVPFLDPYPTCQNKGKNTVNIVTSEFKKKYIKKDKNSCF